MNTAPDNSANPAVPGSTLASTYRPKQFTRGVTANPRNVVYIAIVASLLLHLVVGGYLMGVPLGIVDPAQLEAFTRVYKVKRSQPMDAVVADDSASAAGDNQSASDLGKALLQSPGSAPDAGEIDIVLRDTAAPDDLARQHTPDVDLAAAATFTDVIALMQGPSLRGPSFNPGPNQAGNGQGQGQGQGQGTGPGSGSGDGTGSEQAANLLRQAGLDGRPAAPLTVDVARPDIEPVRRQPAQRVAVTTPLPEIDLNELALAGSDALLLPETLDDDFEYRLTRLPGDADEPGYFSVEIIGRRTLRKLKSMPKDVVFLIDTSGSVPASWVKQSVAGVGQGLNLLNEQDRFNIVMFKDNPAFFSTAGPQQATAENIAKAQQFLKGAESSGWTDMNTALSRLLVRDLDQQRVYYLVLISDGQPTRGVINTRDLINLITRNNDLAASIYCVGVGRRVNRELLDFLAYRNKGFSIEVERSEEAATTILGLMSRLRYPIIKDVRLNVVGLGPDAQVYPRDLPNIHQGERAAIYGQYDQPGEFTTRITGSNGAQPVDFTFTRELANAEQGDETIRQRWAFWKLHDLYAQMIRFGETEELKQQIRTLQREHRIKTLY